MPSKYSPLEGLVSSEELVYRASYRFIMENLDYSSEAYDAMLSNLKGRWKR